MERRGGVEVTVEPVRRYSRLLAPRLAEPVFEGTFEGTLTPKPVTSEAIVFAPASGPFLIASTAGSVRWRSTA